MNAIHKIAIALLYGSFLLAHFNTNAQYRVKKENKDESIQSSAIVIPGAEHVGKTATDNIFNFNLLNEVVKNEEDTSNIIISPLSVAIALSMTANGAKGQTQNSIYKTLNAAQYKSSFNNHYYRQLMDKLNSPGKGVQINIANSIWYASGFSVKPEFIRDLKIYYNASAQQLDFKDKNAVRPINDWVAEKTDKKIPKIVNQLQDDLRMLIINAVYFKGQWLHPFDKKNTSKKDFHTANGPIQSDFMFKQGSFKSFQHKDFEMIALPYANESYNMIVLLPSAGKKPAELIASLRNNDNLLPSATASLQSRQTRLWIPKFKFAYENILNDELDTLGMGLALSHNANFKGISPDADLFISQVKHKAYIEVNEEGTEAAAVTSVGVSVTSMPMYHDIDVNRPFLFFIQDTDSGMILFSGLVNNPNGGL